MPDKVHPLEKKRVMQGINRDYSENYRAGPLELLAPAGNLQRLKTAVLYGADAVYLGGRKYCMRARADNFSEADLAQAVDFAHRSGAKVYLALNALMHEQDLQGFEQHCRFLESLSVDAVIVSDLGALKKVKESSDLAVHLSTQAHSLNHQSARLWKSLGAARVVVGRELSIAEAAAVRQSAGIEVEVFIHGAMCMSYSGNCAISNFTAGRDANRGCCIQSCRFNYCQVADQGSRRRQSHFLSSKDLMGAGLIKDFFDSGIDSIKIEGRMKSALYVATICKAYRKLIDACSSGGPEESLLAEARRELAAVPHRDYCSGSLEFPAGQNSVYQDGESTSTWGTHRFVGTVLAADSSQVVVRLLAPLACGDQIEILPFRGEASAITVERMKSIDEKDLNSVKQERTVILPIDNCQMKYQPYNLVRMSTPPPLCSKSNNSYQIETL